MDLLASTIMIGMGFTMMVTPAAVRIKRFSTVFTGYTLREAYQVDYSTEPELEELLKTLH